MSRSSKEYMWMVTEISMYEYLKKGYKLVGNYTVYSSDGPGKFTNSTTIYHLQKGTKLVRCIERSQYADGVGAYTQYVSAKLVNSNELAEIPNM